VEALKGKPEDIAADDTRAREGSAETDNLDDQINAAVIPDKAKIMTGDLDRTDRQ
jgi:hypothetical protein